MQTKFWTDLSDEQAEKVVGGVGVVKEGSYIFGEGFYGWFGGPNHMDPADHQGLINAGFSPGAFEEAGPNTISRPA